MASIAITVGIAAASAALQYLLAPRVKQEPVDKGKVDDVRITASEYGAFIPRLWGGGRFAGNIIWTKKGVEEFVVNTPSGGGKGVPQAPATRTYIYKSTFAVLICRGQISDFLRMWADADLITNNSEVQNGSFEAEAATLSGGASVLNPDATASGGQSVENLGNGGKAVFDVSSVTDPTEPNPGDPDEVAIAYTRISFFYKCSSDLTADIDTDVSSPMSFDFPATGSDWTTKTVNIPGHADEVTFENAAADAPDLDLITIEKYWLIEVLDATFQSPGYQITGIVNEDIAYPGDPDDPSEFYNLTPEADGNGVYSLTTPIPGELIRFYKGTTTQGQDSAIVSWLDGKYGSGEGVLRCPAFRDIAYVTFESRTLKQGRVENFTFELTAGSATVNTILADLLEDVGIESSDYDLTATAGLTQTGFVEHTPQSRRALVEHLERYHQFRIVEVDGKVKTVLDTTVSAATIDADLLRAHNADDQMPEFDAEVLIKDRSQMAREVRVSIMNPEIEYHNESVPAAIFASHNAQESREYAFPIIDTPDNARAAAEKLLLKEHSEDKAIEFWGMPEMAQYSPGDVITVPINGVNTTLRIEKMQMQLPLGAIRFQCVSVSPFTPTYYQTDFTESKPKSAPQYADYNFPRNAVVIPIVSEPLNSSEVGKLGTYLAVCGRGRGTSQNFGLYREKDADNYVLQSIVDVPAIAGLCAGTLATHGTPETEDTTNTLDIWFFDDIELETVTQGDLDADLTLNLIRIGDEWVQFRTAAAQTLEENSPYRSKWRISNLWRERFGTDGKAATHGADEYAVLYTRAVFFYELNQIDVGEDINFKAVTNGQNEENASVCTLSSFAPEYSYTVSNETDTRTLDADATDLDELADVVATILKDKNLAS